MNLSNTLHKYLDTIENIKAMKMSNVVYSKEEGLPIVKRNNNIIRGVRKKTRQFKEKNRRESIHDIRVIMKAEKFNKSRRKKSKNKKIPNEKKSI